MKTKIKVQTKFTDSNPLVKIVNKQFFGSIYRLVELSGASKVLDCGCGEGLVIESLKKRMPQGKYYGFDIDSDSVSLAKELNPKAEIKMGNIYKVPFPDSFAPVAICTEVLEHLEEPDKALKELKRVSSKYVVVSVPYEPIFRISNMLRLKYMGRFGNTPGHINNWTPFAFKELLKKHFKIEKEIFPLPWMMFLLKK